MDVKARVSSGDELLNEKIHNSKHHYNTNSNRL